MDIKEVKILIRRKKLGALKTSDGNYGINTERFSNYYSGIAEGLRIAEEILGMLNKPNRIRVEK